MIVKVQTSLPDGDLVLIYDHDQTYMDQFPASGVPHDVLQATLAKGGKTFFYAELKNGELRFGVQAPPQEW